jgi:plastocyanin
MTSRKIFGLSAVAVLLVTVGCGNGGGPDTAESEAPAAAEEYFKVDPATAAGVSGKVNFDGKTPKAVRINMSAEPDCKKLHKAAVHAQQVVVNENGTLQNVFVWVKTGLEGKKFEVTKNASLNQKGCIYRPHVIAMQAGGTISVSNGDPLTHNVHPLPKVNREWNKSQTSGASDIKRKFARQEIMLPVKCNIHPWMRAYINVVSHPFFAVTGEDGSFEIPGLPPGTYTVEAKHEKYGDQEMSVTLGDSESKEVDFTFSAG